MPFMPDRSRTPSLKIFFGLVLLNVALLGMISREASATSVDATPASEAAPAVIQDTSVDATPASEAAPAVIQDTSVDATPASEAPSAATPDSSADATPDTITQQEAIEALARRLGVSPGVLRHFGNVLKGKGIPPSSLGRAIPELVFQHKRLLEQIERPLAQGASPEVKTWVTEATDAVRHGDYRHAVQLLSSARQQAKTTWEANVERPAAGALLIAHLADLEGQAQMGQVAFEAAIPLFEEAVAVIPDGEVRAKVHHLNQLGMLMAGLGKMEEAQKALSDALSRIEAAPEPDVGLLGATAYNLALVHEEQGHDAIALDYFNKALINGTKLTSGAKPTGDAHPAMIKILEAMVTLHKRREAWAEMEPLLERMVNAQEKLLGKDHPSLVRTWFTLGTVHYKQAHYEPAHVAFTRALTLAEQVLGKDHLMVANILDDLGLLNAAQGKYAEAKAHYERALAIREQLLGKDHPGVAKSLNTLAIVYEQDNQPDKAKPLFERALVIMETMAPNHPLTESYRSDVERINKIAK
jgi:tetratricopeptide (TPR) repeat protein